MKSPAVAQEAMRALAQSGRTLVVSSHILPELQQLADRFAIINQGRWVTMASGQPFFTRAELQQGFAAARWLVRCNRPADAVRALGGCGIDAAPEGDTVSFAAADEPAAAALLRAVVESGVEVYDFRRRQVELTELVLDVLQQDNGPAGRGGPPRPPGRRP